MENSHYIIELIDMTFHAFHGVHDFEKIEGNTFVVNVYAEMNYRPVHNLYDTVDYSAIAAIVETEMNSPRELLETLADSICDNILERFVSIKSVKVKIEKRNPPITQPTLATAVSLIKYQK